MKGGRRARRRRPRNARSACADAGEQFPATSVISRRRRAAALACRADDASTCGSGEQCPREPRCTGCDARDEDPAREFEPTDITNQARVIIKTPMTIQVIPTASWLTRALLPGIGSQRLHRQVLLDEPRNCSNQTAVVWLTPDRRRPDRRAADHPVHQDGGPSAANRVHGLIELGLQTAVRSGRARAGRGDGGSGTSSSRARRSPRTARPRAGADGPPMRTEDHPPPLAAARRCPIRRGGHPRRLLAPVDRIAEWTAQEAVAVEDGGCDRSSRPAGERSPGGCVIAVSDTLLGAASGSITTGLERSASASRRQP